MSFRPLDAKAPALLLRELKPLRDLLHSAEQLNRLQQLLDELIADCMGMVAALGQFSADLFGRCLGVEENDQPRPNGRWLSYTQDLHTPDALAAVHLALARSRELETVLRANPQLLRPDQAMQRLHWLCQQRLDRPITAEAISLK